MTAHLVHCTEPQLCFVVTCAVCPKAFSDGDHAGHFTDPQTGAVQARAAGWTRRPDGRLVCTRTDRDHDTARQAVLPDDDTAREYVALLKRRSALLEETAKVRDWEPRPDALYAELDRLLARLLTIRSSRPDLHDVMPDDPSPALPNQGEHAS